MHDKREWWRQYVAAVEVAGASEGDDRAQSSCYSAHQTKEGELTAPRGPIPGESGAATVRIPITPGWDLRPGADLSHFDQLICLTPRTLLSWASKIRAVFSDAVAPETACILRLCIVAGAIVTAFGLGWFCGWTSYSSRTARAETWTVTSSSEKRAVSISGNVRSNAPTPATLTRTYLKIV
jgi:hypothetical protein